MKSSWFEVIVNHVMWCVDCVFVQFIVSAVSRPASAWCVDCVFVQFIVSAVSRPASACVSARWSSTSGTWQQLRVTWRHDIKSYVDADVTVERSTVDTQSPAADHAWPASRCWCQWDLWETSRTRRDLQALCRHSWTLRGITEHLVLIIISWVFFRNSLGY